MLIVIFIIFMILSAIIYESVSYPRKVATAKANALQEAKARYDESLTQLKLRPIDPDLKQETLALGREYSDLTRDQKGVTIFDEIALANDISAVCAAATAAVQPTNDTSVTAETRLAELSNLEAKGLVTEEEYQEQRLRILSAL